MGRIELFYSLYAEPVCCAYLGKKYCPHGKNMGNADGPCLNEGMFGDGAAGCVKVAEESERREKKSKLDKM